MSAYLLDTDTVSLLFRPLEEIYRAMPASLRRVGSGDCKIAATALHYDLIVVTRNLRHFGQIPGITCEDWTQQREGKPTL
ncbi:type II toxin-antitoxin system VapC family toxin [Armatimonas sp.]|uniref:type II toxin-antitoxin system VapC family toxin n=1 Tax=Armatimonas sp. TaxID=1872638 RepID=UPI003751A15C